MAMYSTVVGCFFVKVKIIRFVVCSVIELFFSREDKVVIYVSLML